MPLDPAQVQVDADFITQQPGWTDPEKRRDFIREVAVKSRANVPLDQHTAVINELWARADQKSLLERGTNFVGRATEEVLKSMPASGGAVMFAVNDLAQGTPFQSGYEAPDTGSSTRLKRGVANLWDATGQRLKQVMPGDSNQAIRDASLEALKADVDNNLHPQGLESWLAGELDDGKTKPDAETQQWLDALSGGMARKAVAADYMGQVDPEKVRAWLDTDRNPMRADSDIPGQPGPREYLADYVATRDPSSWEAFMGRVTETDTQHTTRLRRWVAEQKSAPVVEAMPQGLTKDLVQRSMDMQTSPIDLASSFMPLLRGAKALQAAKAGGFMAAGTKMLKGGLEEGVQEGLTSYLDDPRNKAGTVLESAALGTVGNTVIEGSMATGGAALHHLTRPSPTSNPKAAPVKPQTAPAAPAANPNSMAAIAERGGAQPVAWSPTTRQPILTDVPDGPPTITVPETQATLQEQLNRTAEGLKPATFIPDQSKGNVTVPEVLVSTPVTSPEPGVMVHRPDMDPATVEQASQEAPGELMGMGIPTKPADADRAIVLRRADGTPVLDVGSNAETETQVREALGKMAKEGDTITVEAPEAVIQERTEQERTAPRVGEIVTHEGYTGRLVQDGARFARFAVQVPNGPTVEVPSLTGLTRNTDLKTAQAIGLAELENQGQSFELKEASFQAAPDGSLSIQDNEGNTFVPHNPQLLRSVRPGPNGLEVLVRNPKQPGRIIKLTGAQAQNAQEAFLKAAEIVEANGGKVNWGTTPKPRFQFSQGNNQSDGLAEFRRALDILLEGDKKSQTDPDLKSKWALWDLWSYLVQDPKTQKKNAPHLTAFWSKMASFTDAFQYGKTTSPNMADIAQALSLPGKPISMEDHGSYIRVTGVNGSLDIKAARTARPYISSLEAASAGKEGGGGTQLYQAALDWIHNNGKRLRSDPAGITSINAIRRTSNMLSSALRWGTTKHLGHNRFQDLSWSPKSDAWNIANMATTEMWHAFKALENTRNWRYDFSSDRFIDNDTGKPISNDELRTAVLLGSPDRTGIGFSTLQRAILTASALEGFQRGKPADTLLEAETRRRAGSGLKRFLYSQGGTLAQALKGPQLQKATQEAVRLLNAHLPGLVSSKVKVFQTAQEFLESGHVNPSELTAEEIAKMQASEGFLDNQTGDTIVIAENVNLEPGETPRSAIARVVMHERIGHEGLNTLLASDPEFAKQWEGFSAQIPQADLDTIAAQEGYEDIAGDRNLLALEWFARQVRPDGKLSGTPLVTRMWNALKTWIKRAYAGFPKRSQFDQELHQIINLAQDAILERTTDPTTPSALTQRLQFSLGGTRIAHREGEPYRVNDRATRAILTGTTLPRAFVETVAQTERERRSLDQTAAQLGNDLKAAVESYATRSGQPIGAVYDLVNQALSGAPGTNAVLMQADPALHTRALRARTFLDDLSQAIAQTLPVGNLRNTIVLNQGAWMKRSYAAFDPASGWNYDTVMQAARDGKDIAGKPARQIVANAMRYLRQQTPQANRAEIEANMRDLMDRDTWTGYLSGREAIRKDITSLMARQSLPVEIRALMGEETNPVKRLLQSASFQSQFLHRHQQQTALRTIGLNNGLFQNQRGGVYTQEIPHDNPRWSPLAGIWTTPQLWQAMQEMDGLNTGNDLWSKAGEALKILGNEAKFNRVAANPDSWMVNILGNVVALVQTGDMFYSSFFRRVGQAVALQRAGKAKPGEAQWNVTQTAGGQIMTKVKGVPGTVLNAAQEAITDAQRALVARLTASGVIGENFTLRDLEASLPRHLLQWVAEDSTRDTLTGAAKGALWGQAAGRGFGAVGRVVGGTIGAAIGAKTGYQGLQKAQQTLAAYVMTGPDAIGRLTGFLGNYETALAAGMTPDQAAFTHASERTRNTFPDYGRMPAILKTLSRYGVAGSFIGFQYEVYRNTIWNARYALQDLRSGNAALVRKGIARTIGAATVGTLAAGGLQAIFQNMAGTDDDRNKKWRKWFGAPWEKNGVLVFTDYTPEGVSYFNTSYLIPQSTLAELVNAASSGEDPGDAAGRVMAHVWEQFMGSSVHLGPIISAAMNVDRMGRPITNKDGIPGALERLDSAQQTILEPGWAAKMERLEYVLRKAERRGRTFSLEEEINRFIGIRQVTRTWPDLVKRGYDNFAHKNSAIRAQANKLLGDNLPGAQTKAITEANAALQALALELQEYESDLRSLGVPEAIVRKARKDSSAPKHFSLLEIDREAGNRVKSIKR